MIKTAEELVELLELLAVWVHARNVVNDVHAEYGDRVKELREAERKLSEAVINVADSTDEHGSEPDEDER